MDNESTQEGYPGGKLHRKESWLSVEGRGKKM